MDVDGPREKSVFWPRLRNIAKVSTVRTHTRISVYIHTHNLTYSYAHTHNHTHSYAHTHEHTHKHTCVRECSIARSCRHKPRSSCTTWSASSCPLSKRIKDLLSIRKRERGRRWVPSSPRNNFSHLTPQCEPRTGSSPWIVLLASCRHSTPAVSELLPRWLRLLILLIFLLLLLLSTSSLV